MTRLLIICMYLFFAPTSHLNADDRINVNLKSDSMGEVRPIFIRLPVDYVSKPAKKYPTLYILNDKDNFDWASYIVSLQASKFGIEDMLVVGLPHTGNYWRDNYPFKGPESIEINPQAHKYSAFIREEVIPYIEKNYRVNEGRFIIGHSLSGVFITHLYTQHPDTFSTFVALSPSFHHAPQMPNVVENFLKTERSASGQLYMSLGRLEHEQIQKGYDQIRQTFDDYAPKGLRYHLGYMGHTDHLLAAFNGIYNALAWIYADYTVPSGLAQSFSYQDYINHYSSMSERLNYQIKPRERYMTGIAQFLAKRIGNRDAGITILKVARHYYPESENIQKLLKELEKLLPDVK